MMVMDSAQLPIPF